MGKVFFAVNNFCEKLWRFFKFKIAQSQKCITGEAYNNFSVVNTFGKIFNYSHSRNREKNELNIRKIKYTRKYCVYYSKINT